MRQLNRKNDDNLCYFFVKHHVKKYWRGCWKEFLSTDGRVAAQGYIFLLTGAEHEINRSIRSIMKLRWSTCDISLLPCEKQIKLPHCHFSFFWNKTWEQVPFQVTWPSFRLWRSARVAQCSLALRLPCVCASQDSWHWLCRRQTETH